MVFSSFPPAFVRQGVPVRRQGSWVRGCPESRRETPSAPLLPHAGARGSVMRFHYRLPQEACRASSVESTTVEDRVARAMLARPRSIVPGRVPPLAFLCVTTETLVQRARLIVHLAQAFVHALRGSAHVARASLPSDPLGAQLRTSFTISLRHAHPFSVTLKQLLLILDGSIQALPRSCRPGWLYSGTTQVMQATLGDQVVLIPPGVSRTLVPLDCALVLQILYGVVVALTVRSDTGAFSSFQKGEVGSW